VTGLPTKVNQRSINTLIELTYSKKRQQTQGQLLEQKQEQCRREDGCGGGAKGNYTTAYGPKSD